MRAGEPQLIASPIQSDYRILVSRFEERPEAQLYPFNLRDPIPQFYLPLLSGDSEPIVNLKAILDEIYEEAALDLAIDYANQPVPPVQEEDWQWMRSVLEGV